MQIVECPHCATRVSNDGSLSERVVTCPECHKQFQMPALVASAGETTSTTAAEAPASRPSFDLEQEKPVAGQAEEDSLPTRRRREGKRSPPLWMAIVGSTVIFWVTVFIVVWLSGIELFGRSSGKAGKGRQPDKGGTRPQDGKSQRPTR